jgi:hypothetical protein
VRKGLRSLRSRPTAGCTYAPVAAVSVCTERRSAYSCTALSSRPVRTRLRLATGEGASAPAACRLASRGLPALLPLRCMLRCCMPTLSTFHDSFSLKDLQRAPHRQTIHY